MPRNLLVIVLSLLSLLFIAPAVAQLSGPPAMAPPLPQMPRMRVLHPVLPPTAELTDSGDLSVDAWMTPETAKAAIEKLIAQRSELRLKLTDSTLNLNEALRRIDEMSHPGGSLVTAYCKSETLSANTAGATEDCGRLRCGAVDGLCRRVCHATDDCAGGFACLNGRCVTGAEAAAMNPDN
jgi:hypothetical protein